MPRCFKLDFYTRGASLFTPCAGFSITVITGFLALMKRQIVTSVTRSFYCLKYMAERTWYFFKLLTDIVYAKLHRQ